MQYISHDGNIVSENVDEVTKYENELKEKTAEQEKKIAEKKIRKQEVIDAYKHYMELERAFVKDYGFIHWSDISTSNNNNFNNKYFKPFFDFWI